MGNQHGAPSSNPHSRSHSPASKSSNRGVGHLIFHSGHSKFNGAGHTTGGIDSGIGSKDPSESGSTHDNWDQNGHKSLPPIPDISQEEVDKVSTNGIKMRSRRNSEGGSKGEEQSSSKRRSVIESEVLQQLKNRKLDLSHMLPESFRRGRRKSSDNNVPIEIKTDTPKVRSELGACRTKILYSLLGHLAKPYKLATIYQNESPCLARLKKGNFRILFGPHSC